MSSTSGRSGKSDPCKRHSSQNVESDKLESLVHHYRQNYGRDAERLNGYYASLSDFEEATEVIGAAELPSGNRHPHQRLIRRETIAQMPARLSGLENDLEGFSRFEDLFDFIDKELGEMEGIGEMTVYDTAHRLGAYFGIEPEHVYLHRGTRHGAQAMGFDGSRKKIAMQEFPSPLREMKPYQVEDFLCLYKEELHDLYGGT